MTRLPILAAALLCFMPNIGFAQPPSKAGEDLKEALKRIGELEKQIAEQKEQQDQAKQQSDRAVRQLEQEVNVLQAEALVSRHVDTMLSTPLRMAWALLKRTEFSREAAELTPRAKTRAILQILKQPIDTKGLQEKVKLKTALEYFSDKFGGKLSMLIDKAAFITEVGPELDPYEEEVSLPPVPNKMPMGTALRLILCQVGKGHATYIIRAGHIEITTLKYSTAAYALIPPSVLAVFDQKPLKEVLQELADETGVEIHLDPSVGKKADTRIAATFRNSSLESALVTVTEMAGLKFVVLERSIFVTTSSKAKIMQKEEQDRAKSREILEKAILKAKRSEAASN